MLAEPGASGAFPVQKEANDVTAISRAHPVSTQMRLLRTSAIPGNGFPDASPQANPDGHRRGPARSPVRARTNMLHSDFPGRLCQYGNMAYPFSASDFEAGSICRFGINHVADVFCPALSAHLCGVPKGDVLFTPYDAAFSVKATVRHSLAAGVYGGTDVYGCQQHVPLLDVDPPI